MRVVSRYDADNVIWEGESLRRAYQAGANLAGADLYGADLCGADLRRADLCGADLYGADLRGANLDGADLGGADLRRADLRRADLRGADLGGADLRGANLGETVLDPDAEPNADVCKFVERDGDYVIGYRTRKAGHIDMYRDGRFYSADFFSVCETECHPGLYLWPSLKDSKSWSRDGSHIRVRTRASEVHKAGAKWRCRWFEVLGDAK